MPCVPLISPVWATSRPATNRTKLPCHKQRREPRVYLIPKSTPRRGRRRIPSAPPKQSGCAGVRSLASLPMAGEPRDSVESVLSGTYTIERELGGGGMSRVFAATETALGRRVVIKMVPAELAASVNVDRFKREIQLAANLQHPHIVPVLAAGEVDGVPYYTMPFVDGESLRARIARGPVPIAD